LLGPIRAHNPNGTSIDSSVFAYEKKTDEVIEVPFGLYFRLYKYFIMVCPYPLKITRSSGGSGPLIVGNVKYTMIIGYHEVRA